MKIDEVCSKTRRNRKKRMDEVTDVSGFLNPDQTPGETMMYINKLINMLEGAKRGLSLVNRLKDKEERLWHLHNVFINMNKIRGALAKVEKIERDNW